MMSLSPIIIILLSIYIFINKLHHIPFTPKHTHTHTLCHIGWTTDGKTFSVPYNLFAFLNEVV